MPAEVNFNSWEPLNIGGSSVNFATEIGIEFYRRLDEFIVKVLHDKNGMFGEVEDYWGRIEYQYRGNKYIIPCDLN